MLTSGRVPLCLVVFASVLAVLATPASAVSLDVSSVSIQYLQYYLNDVPQNLWEFAIHVEGTGLAGVTVTKPDLSSFALSWSGNDYSTHTVYGSFLGMQNDYPTGTYGLSINGELNFDLVLDGTAPDGIVTDLLPTHLSTGVALAPAFSWTGVPNTYGGAIGTTLLRADTGQNYGEIITDVLSDMVTGDLMDVTSTSWAPGVTLDPSREYALEVGVYRGTLASLTVGGDTFDAAAVYGFMNQSDFTTVPEPATLFLLGIGAAGARVLRRRR